MKSKLPAEDKLLTREEFDRYVKLRSNGRCVFCQAEARDSHHVLDRKLYPDGGYYLGNGAALCNPDHFAAEMTVLSVEEVRIKAGIKVPVLPPDLDPSKIYDKWGNEVLEDGFLKAGPLKDDDGMKRALGMANKQWRLR